MEGRNSADGPRRSTQPNALRDVKLPCRGVGHAESLRGGPDERAPGVRRGEHTHGGAAGAGMLNGGRGGSEGVPLGAAGLGRGAAWGFRRRAGRLLGGGGLRPRVHVTAGAALALLGGRGLPGACWRGPRHLADEDAVPALRQRQEQAGGEDQGSGRTAPHTPSLCPARIAGQGAPAAARRRGSRVRGPVAWRAGPPARLAPGRRDPAARPVNRAALSPLTPPATSTCGTADESPRRPAGR